MSEVESKRETIRPEDIGTEYLSIDNMCAATGVQRQTLYNYIKSGLVKKESLGRNVFIHKNYIPVIQSKYKLNTTPVSRLGAEVGIESEIMVNQLDIETYEKKIEELEQENINLRNQLTKSLDKSVELEAKILGLQAKSIREEVFETLYTNLLKKHEELQSTKDDALKGQVNILMQSNKELAENFGKLIDQTENFQKLLAMPALKEIAVTTEQKDVCERKGLFGFRKNKGKH